MVAIFGVVLARCWIVNSTFSDATPQPFASLVQRIEKPEANGLFASAGDLQLPMTPAAVSGVSVPASTAFMSVAANRRVGSAVGRVPDQRVSMSTPIKTVSRTVLPDGRAVSSSIAGMP